VGEDEPSCYAVRSEDLTESSGKQMMHKGTGTVYRIVVRSELSERYAVAFEGMEMETKRGNTVLTGDIIDQPHLHGILDRINGLGLELLSVQALPEDTHQSTGGKREPKEPKT
jgi:outer membrane PBP1 activator LpoA protein